MQKWEYLRIVAGYNQKTDYWYWEDLGTDTTKDKVVDRLNKLGKEGWELVSVNSEAGLSGQNWTGMTTRAEYYFKRPI